MSQERIQTTPEQDRCLSTLLDIANIIQKTQINLKKCSKQRLTKGYLQARLKSLEDYWNTFKQAHNNLTACTPREQKGMLPYFLNEDFYQVEDLYLVLQADLTDHLIKLEKTDANNMSTVSSDTQPSSVSPLATLPRIQLPTFSGRYEDWPTYQDLFTALVHNTNLSNVQKLHYLKTSVSGEAEILLRHIQTSENNYLQAWDLLKGRFGNKKMILNAILKRLFGQKKVTNQTSVQIKNLLDTTAECINNLNNLTINTDSWDPILIFLVCQKLDPESLKDWEEFTYKNQSDELPTWDALKGFLEAKFRTLELIMPMPGSKERITTQKLFHTTAETTNIHAGITTQHTCTYCKNNHYIFQCKDFSKLPVDQRQEFVKTNKLCYNCLIPNHNAFKCKQSTSCRICKRKHHSLLHHSRDTKQTSQVAVPIEPCITTAHLSHDPGHEVLLATAQVSVTSRYGHKHLLRALIDQGSEASFVSARVVDLLGLPKTNIDGIVSGIGEGSKISIKHCVDLTIMSRLNENEVIQVKAYVLKTISSKLPSKHITTNTQLQTLPLADPTYNTPSKIDMLLGADVFCKIIEDGLLKMNEGLVAQKTSLGWILSGKREDKLEISNQHNIITLHITRMVEEDNNMLRRFWEIETELYNKKKIFTKEEEMCEDLYKNTTKRDTTGKYIVHLPLKYSIEETVNLCKDTKEQAVRRFQCLERKFAKYEELKNEYAKVINEYIEMGHMKKIETNDDKPSIYLPHHAVIREDKETSKVRVVYDAAAKGSKGYSLNDCMMIGPVLQRDLRSLIISWRTHKICVVGDIVKMYRMINMTDEHTNLQRIVWRDNPDKELQSYNLTTVTFGTAAAPYLAVRTLHQLAEDEVQDYPGTAAVIKNSFYMDDLMAGHENVAEVKKMCSEIKMILKKGGFEMQKWSSNSEEVLEHLREEEAKNTVEIKLDKIIKILGLTWDRKDDEFKITVNLPEIKYPITKRSILSDVARLFDPFGWLAPVVISAKILIQRLWLCSVGWDDELPINFKEEWEGYRKDLIHLQNIKIPRWFKTTRENLKNITLHGFADASTQAYAAVTYLRIEEGDEVHVVMIASRTKVAPLKQLSVPRLELCAAVLLAELIKDVVEILKIPDDKIFAWTDSTVVLSWLQSQPNRWRTFVANRVAEITRIINNDRWRHVRSTDNPADISTRCIKSIELVNHKIWWTGPTWLKEDISVFNLTNFDIPQTQLESKLTCNLIVEEQPIWERFSTLSRMKRVLAYCKRVFRRDKSESRLKHLQTKELDSVLNECIKYYQNLVYEKDIEEIKKKGNVKNRSSLISLSPFLDSEGILRVGGRLQNSTLSDLAKHPIIIPSNQHITKLLVNEAHIRTLHGGIQLMMSYLRTGYWIVGLKSNVKKCIRNCKICIVDKAKTKYQFMGQLPAVRVNQHRAFLNSGVDYAGPVWIRSSKGRGHHASKGYICLFVCMATRAIHLEAVTDLTSQAFIAAFRRFVARRGYCQHLWSDNGTNFVGAAKELKDLFRASRNNIVKDVAEILANDGVTWHFIPARMPTCGGLWEAGIQSAKRHLTRVNTDTKLTFEEMTTLLAQIEACLNSRPLCQVDNTTEDILTPGHFLVGEPLVSVPDQNYEIKNINLLTRWQLIQKLTQHFWHKWQAEYLNTLQQRHKWQKEQSSPAVGDVVIIKDEVVPPTKWLHGRIKELHPGKDDLVRVVTVECKGGHHLKRPLYKVIPLPKNFE